MQPTKTTVKTAKLFILIIEKLIWISNVMYIKWLIILN